MERAQARDRDAFEMLVERHLGDMHRIAVAIVGPADAMDITQETFVVAWQQVTLRNPDAFTGWLRRICVNTARQWLRRTRRRGPTSPMDNGHLAAGAMDLVDQRPDFRAAVEARVVLEPAIERLSPEQRALLALHYTLGYSIADAADALGIRVGTAKSRVNAALNALRRSIGTPAVTVAPEAAP